MESTNILGLTGTSPSDNSFVLDDHQKSVIRASMINVARTLLGIPYKMGQCQADYDAGVGQWRDLSKLPENLDCQGLVKGVCAKVGLKIPEGAQHQFDFTIATTTPNPGDFAFFGYDKNILKIYHIGLVFDDHNMIEARGLQPESSFETGKVILRPRVSWENYQNFTGYRSHPRLI